MQPVSVVISYSSLEQRFLKSILYQSSLFADDIIVAIYKNLLNGKEEDVGKIEMQIASHLPSARVVVLDHDINHSGRHHHNLARWEGARLATHDHILFLDGDEIPEGQIFRSLLANNLLGHLDGADFACHWYFRNASYQALQLEHCGLLIRKDLITESTMFTENERWSFRLIKGIKYIPMLAINNQPIMHHFSWVRTRDEMLEKVSGWGHKRDKNWKALIVEEFSRQFNGTDFVHGYQYKEVANKFGIDM
jgi:hypothetical protein